MIVDMTQVTGAEDGNWFLAHLEKCKCTELILGAARVLGKPLCPENEHVCGVYGESMWQEGCGIDPRGAPLWCLGILGISTSTQIRISRTWGSASRSSARSSHLGSSAHLVLSPKFPSRWKNQTPMQAGTRSSSAFTSSRQTTSGAGPSPHIC